MVSILSHIFVHFGQKYILSAYILSTMCVDWDPLHLSLLVFSYITTDSASMQELVMKDKNNSFTILVSVVKRTLGMYYLSIFYNPRNILLSLLTYLTHWGRATHICVSKQTNTGLDNGLSPGRRQAIIWNNAGILLIRTLGTNFS